MKRIYLYITGVIALMTGFTSCSEKFLEIPQTDIVDPTVLLTSQTYVEQGLNGIYDLFYGERTNSDDLLVNWNLKPHVGFCNYPALDLQATGWDIPLNTHEWKSDFYMFGGTWQRCYRVIDRANKFLANLENADVNIFDNGETTKKMIEAEARAIRAYFYSFLCQVWGGVPMLMTGDTYSNSPSKPRSTAADAWNLVISDLEFARDNLNQDYTPRNGQIGRVTKGMAQAYLGQAFMYINQWDSAKQELKAVIDCGKYSLNPCFYYIHTPSQVWQPESIWEVAYPTWGSMTWGAESSTDAVMWWGPMFSGPDLGGWGPAAVSYEYCWSFEPGDKRLDYSVVQMGNMHPSFEQQLGKPGSVQTGAHDATNTPFVTGDNIPNNFFIKFWKQNNPTNPVYTSFSITLMRLAGVMLNYAECCFETNNMPEGWKYINLIRNRAWGQSEPNAVQTNLLQIPLNTDPSVHAPDAETYYNNYKRADGTMSGPVNMWKGWMKNSAGGDSIITTGGTKDLKVGIYEKQQIKLDYQYKGYTSPPWKVALIMERRHEFLGEYSLWQDLCRMGVVNEYLNAEYPKNSEPQSANATPHTYRPNDFYDYMMLYPIPLSEMQTNSALKPEDQNPGYN